MKNNKKNCKGWKPSYDESSQEHEQVTSQSRSSVREITDTFFGCPDCGGVVVWADGEHVCQKCGRVFENDRMDNSLPFDSTFALTSGIAWGKSLGETLRSIKGKSLVHSVIAEAPQGKKDLPIRAIHIRTITRTDSPFIRSALNHASTTLRTLFVEEDHLVGNDVGNLIRKVGYVTLTTMKTIDFSPTALSLVCLSHVFKKHRCVVQVDGKVVTAKEYFKPDDNVAKQLKWALGELGDKNGTRPH